MFGRGGGELGLGAVAVGVGHAVDFGAGLAAADEAVFQVEAAGVLGPIDGNAGDAAEGDAEGGFFAVDAHFQVLFGGVADAVERERGQAFFGEAEGGIDEDVGVEFRADLGGEDVDGFGQGVEEEAGQIERVGAEFKERVLLQRTAPVGFLAGGVEHLLPALDVEGPAELALFQAALGFGVVGHVAVLVVDAKEEIFGAGEFDDFGGFFDRRHERFFAEDVDAGFEGLAADFVVRTGRGAEDDEVRLGLGEEFFEAGVGFADAELGRHGLAGLRVGVRSGGNFQPGDGRAGGKVDAICDAAEADDASAYWHKGQS